MSYGVEIFKPDGSRQVLMDRRYRQLIKEYQINFTYSQSVPQYNEFVRIYVPGYEPNSGRWAFTAILPFFSGSVYIDENNSYEIYPYKLVENNVGDIYINYNTHSTGSGKVVYDGMDAILIFQFWRY